MRHLLHLDASARSVSVSRELSGAFAQAWRGSRTYRDLAAEPVPPIDEAWTEICDNVLADGITDIDRLTDAVRTDAQKRAWAIVEPLLAELVRADVVLIGTPMYNFSVPATLKAWIDQVTFPRMSLAGRTFVVVSARGGAYGPGAPREPYDHQGRYLRDFFKGHFAVEDVHMIDAEFVNARVDPALARFKDAHAASYAAALDAARELAERLSSAEGGAA